MYGFFITISRSPKSAGLSNKWKAQLHDKLNGWQVTLGLTFEEVIALQKRQYYSKRDTHHEMPPLISNLDWPKATGQITRFVEIE